MIAKIGVIYQDANSMGFLRGLRNRLGCDAEFIVPPAAIGKSRELTTKQAALAWRYFQKRGADLILRFTDADGDRWQDVRRHELDVFPSAANSILVCGVAVNNTEDWLYLDPQYLATELGIPIAELHEASQRTDRIKRAIQRRKRADEGLSDFVEGFVGRLPKPVFRRWLDDESLRRFYSECRAEAIRADCPTPNELDVPEHE